MHGARTAIMAGDEEASVAELPHHLDLVLRHGTERVVGAAWFFRRRGTIAIAAQVSGDDMEVLREAWRDSMPGDVAERVAVQQQQWRTVAAMAQMDARAGRIDIGLCEAGHDGHGRASASP